MLTYASLTKPGDRTINEDSMAVARRGNDMLFILADGLGGHGRGEEASGIVADICREVFTRSQKTDLADLFQQSQDYLMAEQIRLNARNEMKSTLVLLEIAGNSAFSGHIGDSRLYVFRKAKLLFCSLDHSVPQMLVSTGDIKEKDIRGHEDRNRLLRVMGMEWSTPKYELHNPLPLTNADSFLLCSDGFWEWIDEKQMMKTLKHTKTPEAWLTAMEEIVSANGEGHNMDNYTAITVWNR